MIRKTLQWIATLLILVALGGGGYAYWFVTHTDELLGALLRERLAKKLPNAEITFSGARFDWGRKVHMYNVKLAAKSDQEVIAHCAEIVIAVDGEELKEDQTIDIRSVRFVRPQIQLVRDAERHWNWRKILPLAEPELSSPEIICEGGQIQVALAQKGLAATSLLVETANAHFIPSARRQYTVTAGATMAGLGDIGIDARFDIDQATWSLKGKTTGVASIGELIETVKHFAPDAGDRLAAFQARLLSGPSSGAVNNQHDSGLKVTGETGIDLQVSRAADGSTDYQVLATLSHAQLEHPLLPYPLSTITGKIFIDNRRLILKKLEARHGATYLALDGQVSLPMPSATNRIAVKIQDLPLDEHLRDRLPQDARRLFDSIRPGGQIDLEGAFVVNERKAWEPVGWLMSAKHCTGAHEKFPYPVTDIVGTIRQQEGRFLVDLKGRASDRPARMTGTIVHPGSEAQADYVLEIQRLPINDVLRKAAEAEPPFYKTLAALRLRGALDVRCRFHRPAGPRQKVQWQLAAQIVDGSLEYEKFPYQISDLSGKVRFDSTKGEWTFKDLRGTHGPARIWGAGTFVKTSKADPGRLSLMLRAEDAPLNKDLEAAFPPSTQKLWDLVWPTGKAGAQVTINWIPGRGNKPEITIPEATISEGSVQIRSFPYPLDHVTARFEFRYDPKAQRDMIRILAFEGSHDETHLRTEDAGRSFVLCPAPEDPLGQWRLRFERLVVDDLVPDRALRHALPPGLRNTLHVLNPQGKISLAGMLELRGTQRDNDAITAAWDIRSDLTGATIVTGVDLKNVFGTVTSKGTWDGNDVSIQGDVSLNSVHVWNHQFTKVRGPFTLENGELVVGSWKAFQPLAAGENEPLIPDEERITAEAIGGRFFLDAKAHLDGDRTDYRLRAAMLDGYLEEYVRQHSYGLRSLSGVMRGWIELQGATPDPKDLTGRGQLRINPAALYELPLIVQVFRTISFAPPAKAAFQYALTSFNIANRAVNFREIDLSGDAIRLRGRGAATFDGVLHLDFYSEMPRSLINTIPIVSQLVGQAMKGWVGVHVTGTVQNPRTKLQAAPQVDNAFRQFLNAFNPRPGAIPQLTPFRILPAMGPRPQSASATP